MKFPPGQIGARPTRWLAQLTIASTEIGADTLPAAFFFAIVCNIKVLDRCGPTPNWGTGPHVGPAPSHLGRGGHIVLHRGTHTNGWGSPQPVLNRLG